MARKTVFFVCIAMGLGCLCATSAFADEDPEETVRVASGLYYTVQRGDTLWNIAQEVYDFPWVWPDLWEKNPHLANPNWIYPGERIRLFWREELEKRLAPEEEAELEMGIPPGKGPYYLYPAIDSVGFIRDQAVSPAGVIFKVKEDKVLISEGDLVYIRPAEEAMLAAGDHLSVFRTPEPLIEKGTKEFIGIQHSMVGVVRITEVEPEFAMGRVVQAFGAMAVNDLVMPYEEQSPKIVFAKSQEGLEGKIILSQRRQIIIGDQSVVFINRGSKDGVKKGQKYSVYYQEREYLSPEDKEGILLSPVDMGKILILRTEETTATALVTMADKAILPGANIRTPPR